MAVEYQSDRPATPGRGTTIATEQINGEEVQIVKVRETTDYTTEVALGHITGAVTWNKFGYNDDVDTLTPEVLAEFGGAFDQRLADAELMNIVSSDANDTAGGTGVRAIVIFGVGGTTAASRELITDVVTTNGVTPVTTNYRFWGINRMTIFQSGTASSNVGKITATAATSGNTMATMPAGQGTTQQCLFYVPENYQFLATWLYLNAIRSSGGGNPVVTFKAFVYSEVVGSQFEVYRDSIDTAGGSQSIELRPGEPFIIGESSVFWIEADASANNTSVRGRFSGKLIADPA